METQRRRAWTFAAVIATISAALGEACSTSSGAAGAGAADAASDAAPGDAATDELDTSAEAGDGDAGAVSAPEAGGHCSSITGSACDVVLQDCPKGLECVPQIVGTRLTTACRPAGTGNKPAGATCCPGQGNQCVAGLECIGSPCVDGGPELGRCTPRCCRGDDDRCGASIPEGVKGSCDLDVVAVLHDASVSLYRVCSYKPVCRPFRIEACPDSTYGCLLQSDGASFRCDELFSPPGKMAGEPCDIANDCADGMECLGEVDASSGSTCQYTCYREDGGVPPFDVTALDGGGGPGVGGCPAGMRCNGDITGAPRWYAFCQIDRESRGVRARVH